MAAVRGGRGRLMWRAVRQRRIAATARRGLLHRVASLLANVRRRRAPGRDRVEGALREDAELKVSFVIVDVYLLNCHVSGLTAGAVT